MRIPIRVSMLTAFVSVGTLACHDDPVAPETVTRTVTEEVTAAPMLVTAPGHDLDLTFVPIQGSADSGPSRASINAAPPVMPVGYSIGQAQIFRAQSVPYIEATMALNEAVTEFTGNRISVDSRVSVTFLGNVIVKDFTQTTEDTYLFPQTEKRHSAFAQVQLDSPCGHSATGSAQHSAWIDYGPFGWGPTGRGSTGGSVSQPDCLSDVEEDEAGWSWPGAGEGRGEGEIYVCWYRVIRDPEGTVISKTLLYCQQL